MRISLCDRCGKKTDNVNNVGYIKIDSGRLTTMQEWADLCDNCLVDLNDWIHGRDD